MALQERDSSGRFERGIYTRSHNYVRGDADKTCGVCMDVVLGKQPVSERLFAILPNCNHCFCVSCIRTWRKQYSMFDNRVTKGCPECRTVSFYYIPSNCWVEDQAEKKTICLAYKRLMSEIPCRYFLGSGCSFGRKCFYKHSNVSPRDGNSVVLALVYLPGAWSPTGPVVQHGLWTSLA